MAKSQEAALKRLREKKRLDKREAKEAKRAAREADKSAGAPVNEQALWERFARLNERHENNQISLDQFETEKNEIFEALGLETGN